LAYLVLRRITIEGVNFSAKEIRLLPKVWKTRAPPKVVVFSWQLLQDMLSTRQNIYHRGVIGDVDDSLSVMWAQV
jgi:hypothetical protein